MLLIGGRGTGKTTLFRQLLPDNALEIKTWAQPGKAVYFQEKMTGKTAQIGTFSEKNTGKENKMEVCVDGFTGLGIPAVARCIQSEMEWVGIDEIGYLESKSPEYCQAIRNLMQKKHIIAVVRKQDTDFLMEMCDRKDAFAVDLDAPYGNSGCVIMASGMGRRFGGNKLMTNLNGKALAQYIMESTAGIFARRVVVTRYQAVQQLAEGMGISVVFHNLSYRNDTVRLGLEVMHDLEGCMFCPADQPLLSRETIASLALCGARDDRTIWRTAYGEEKGAPIFFPKWTFDALANLPEGMGGGYILKNHPEHVKNVTAGRRIELQDVDYPEDINLFL